MLPVSQEFVTAVTTSGRTIVPKIIVDYTDPFIDQSIQIDATENCTPSYPQQTADGIELPTYKWATLDGSWKLNDGSKLVPETEQEAQTLQMGWWGSTLSNSSRIFSPYPTLTVEHASRPVHSLKVAGDSILNEFPTDFVVRLYDKNNNLLHTETVTNNTEVIWTKQLHVNSVAKSVLELHKWNVAGRIAKILEFFTSVQETYDEREVMFIALSEERDTAGSSLPIGSITSNEIMIRLKNTNRQYDAGNNQSPLFELLKPNRRVRAWLGAELSDKTIEYTPLGIFWTGDWTVPESGVYAEFTGRDRLDMLSKSTYMTSTVQANQSIYDAIENVLVDAGLDSEEYDIDAALKNVIVPYVWFDHMSHREALRLIAEASLSTIYCDRAGRVCVEMYAPSGVSVQHIGRNKYFDKDNPIRWAEVANTVEIETQPRTITEQTKVYQSNTPIEITANEPLTLSVHFNAVPSINAIATLTDEPIGCSIVSIQYYAWGAELVIESAVNGTFGLQLHAQPLKVESTDHVYEQDEASIQDNGMLRYVLPTNHLVQTRQIAERIAQLLLAAYKNPRQNVEIEWIGNPALLTGDVISVQDRYENNLYYVTTHELTYTGALRSHITGRRLPSE